MLDRDWLASPVTVHPRWHLDFFALSRQGAGNAERFIVSLLPSDVRSSAKKTQPATEVPISPYVAVGPPLIAPSGWVEPWTIHYGENWFASLRLPSWLEAAPDDGTGSVQHAIIRCEGMEEPWPARDPLTNPQTLEGIRSIDATVDLDAVVFWWSHDRFDGLTRYQSANTLVDALTSDPRSHLIRGLFDEHSFPLWF